MDFDAAYRKTLVDDEETEKNWKFGDPESDDQASDLAEWIHYYQTRLKEGKDIDQGFFTSKNQMKLKVQLEKDKQRKQEREENGGKKRKEARSKSKPKEARKGRDLGFWFCENE